MTHTTPLEIAARLFNEKRYFECHDQLEELWRDAHGEERIFLKGLISMAVGMYHVANCNHLGAVNLLSRGMIELQSFAPVRSGLDIATLLIRTDVCLYKSRLGVDAVPFKWEITDIPRMDFL